MLGVQCRILCLEFASPVHVQRCSDPQSKGLGLVHLYIYAPLLFCPRSIKKFAAWWLRALDMSLTDECAKESWEVSSGLIPAYLLCTDTVEPVARGRACSALTTDATLDV